jgi:N,N'-diacetyllegionaminate synthase
LIQNEIKLKKETFIIAEIAQAHEGSLGLAHSYIDVLAKTGVDAVKFQTHIADAESSEYEQFRVNFSYEDKTRFDYWKRMEFAPDQWLGLKQHCEEKGMEFISSPFSIAAVELLESLDVKRYKIGSGEIGNWLMLDRIGKTGKPIILSSGMSDLQELDETIRFINPVKGQLSLMQCTTAYPTLPEQWGLTLIPLLKERYQVPIGYSDHSAEIAPSLAAVALGAELLEFHVVFHHEMFGPDAKASLTISQTHELVRQIRMLDQSLSVDSTKQNSSDFQTLRLMFGKSLTTRRMVKAGNVISIDDLESTKPGDRGIPAKFFENILGKQWKLDLPPYHFIQPEDIT